MSYVFISYSRYDKAYVESLAMAMSQHGLNAWYDVDVEGSDPWWRKISQKIEGCAVFVVIMSPDAEDSVWVEREILLADREGKPIIPLLLDGREFGILTNVQYYDMRDGGLPDENFFREVSNYIGEKSLPDTAMLDPAVIAETLASEKAEDSLITLDSLWYSKEHIWVRELANEVATIGITDFGQFKLGYVVQIKLPSLDTDMRPGGVFATIETHRVTSDLLSPILGRVRLVNRRLKDRPDLINMDSFGMGWLLQTRDTVLSNMMDAAEYAAYCKTL